MAASVNDKFRKASGSTKPVVTSLALPKANGATTASLTSATGWNIDTGLDYVMYRRELNTTTGLYEEVDGTRVEGRATLSGTTLSGMTFDSGTEPASGYAADGNTVVLCAPTAQWADDLMDGLLAEHTQSGGHSSITLTGDIKVADTKAIKDGNNNELVVFSQTASAVNELTVANATTTNAPQIKASGGDTNVDIRLVPKGTGYVKRGTTGGAIDWWEELGRTTLGSPGDTISVTIPARKFLKLQINYVASGVVRGRIRFNSDASTNYSQSITIYDGNGLTNQVSQTGLNSDGANLASGDVFQGTAEITNISATQKFGTLIGHLSTPSAGSFSIPATFFFHWANTSAQITTIDLANTGAGDFAAGSELVVLGHD